MFLALMAQELTKANMLLDTAERSSIRRVRARCIVRASEACDAVTDWLRNDDACPADRVPAVEDALRKLNDRLVQPFDEERHR